MRTKDTAELIAIWKENDHGLWSNSAFDVIQKLLLERGASLPIQEEIKVTLHPPPKFEILWNLPYITKLNFSLRWIVFGLFLGWIFIIHPFYFFTYFSGFSNSSDPLSLWPNFGLRLEAFMAAQNSPVYGKLYLSLRYIEFGIMSYGILIGYFVLRKNQKVVSMVKIYLIEFLLFSTCLLLFFNMSPQAIYYWEVNSSIFDLEPDWKMWSENIHAYSRVTGSRWEFFLETLKVYWLPISATIIWYVFLIRSKWLAKTFLSN